MKPGRKMPGRPTGLLQAGVLKHGHSTLVQQSNISPKKTLAGIFFPD